MIDQLKENKVERIVGSIVRDELLGEVTPQAIQPIPRPISRRSCASLVETITPYLTRG